jgi:hypothetical protein
LVTSAAAVLAWSSPTLQTIAARVGTHTNRNITWAEQARPFMTYVARISYMLQQGSPVADIAYLLPEGVPSTMPFWGPKDVQIWRPMDGTMTGNKPGNEAAYTSVARIEERTGNRQPGLQPAYVAQFGFTTVPLHLAERESVFVVFRNVAPASFRSANRLEEKTRTTQWLLDS